MGVLKSQTIIFYPELHEKHDAIHQLGVGTVRKVLLVFKERWWSPADIGLVHAYEERIPTWWSYHIGPILIGWAGGPKTAALKGILENQLLTRSLEILGRTFGERPATLRSLLKVFLTHDWTSDPYIRGAYSYIPVQGMELPKLMAAPLKETLFFAGEAAVDDAQTGMVFNACKSGVRAARELLFAN